MRATAGRRDYARLMDDAQMEVILRKRGSSLIPVDDQGRELLAKLKDGRDVGCTIVQHRNPRHHRLFFAILKFVRMHAVDGAGNSLFEHADEEIIRTAVKMACGLVRTFLDVETDQLVMVPKSIAWGAMDQTKFNGFFEHACNVICKRWMPPGTVPEDVRDELIRMVDGPHALPERAA
jgi:hypothetical protein